MTLRELIEKRNRLLAEARQIMAAPELNNEQRAKVDAMLTDANNLKADIEQPLLLAPGMRARVGTGVHMELPDGYEAQVRPRSGLADRHGITLLNAPGTIDSDYRGEVSVILINLGDEPYEIRPAERIAQIIVAPVSRAAFVLAGELATSERGVGGFGSTGR